jgi:hypothetical protein
MGLAAVGFGHALAQNAAQHGRTATFIAFCPPTPYCVHARIGPGVITGADAIFLADLIIFA